ncbi:hypothetical protein [Streptomyces sp. NBC_01012]|uniref:hypothetical protein n=1 Tax=Streptomyces sp. NBC_01012 TaxID=2903717 RepID=UPI003867EB36|nr:hypothetical protein OG623_05375 [Streptomyces sp. NBC_01012]
MTPLRARHRAPTGIWAVAWPASSISIQPSDRGPRPANTRSTVHRSCAKYRSASWRARSASPKAALPARAARW